MLDNMPEYLILACHRVPSINHNLLKHSPDTSLWMYLPGLQAHTHTHSLTTLALLAAVHEQSLAWCSPDPCYVRCRR